MTSNAKRDAAFDKELKDANRCCESCYNFTLNSRITFERGWCARDAEVAELNAQVDLLSNLVEGNDVCCCGDAIKNHSSPMDCGHSPVSVTDNFIFNTIKERDSLKQQVKELQTQVIQERERVKTRSTEL